MKQFRTLIISAISIFGTFLAACGSDSGTDSDNGADSDAGAEVETIHSLSACKGANEGVTKYVVDISSYYTCLNGQWELSVKTKDDLEDCSADLMGKEVWILDRKQTMVCYGTWKSYAEPESKSSSSEGNSRYSSDSKAAAVDPSTVVTGTMIDERDGQIYKTVKIGDQTWMAENLNYDITGSYCGSYCYDSKYGRLYLWSAAMDSAGIIKGNTANGCGHGSECSINGTVRGACPQGWHMPDTTEWRILIDAVGGIDVASKKLKATSDWSMGANGMDTYSFSALPAGERTQLGGYYDRGNYAKFWSSTENDSYGAYYMGLYDNYDNAYLGYYIKYYGFSVRCLKDDDSKVDEISSSSEEESSSSALSSSSDVSIYDPDENTLTDLRDGQVYRTTTIDIPSKSYFEVWMAENLNYDTTGSYCNNCAQYGRLYTWATAEKVCPTGWHLPSTEEFELLIGVVGGKDVAGRTLKSTSGWIKNGNGSNKYGFSALPAGNRGNDGDYNNEGSHAYFWSSTDYGDSYCVYKIYLYYYDDYAEVTCATRDLGFSVRCLKD